MTAAPLPPEDFLICEVHNLEAWRDQVREAVVYLEDAEYDDETGEPVNRTAEIESALSIAVDEVDQVIGFLQRVVAG